MTQTDYNNMTIPIPPIDVQKKIVVYLDQEYLWFNHAINVIRKKVELLNELKSTLISDVVTGKIDVRNIPVPAYEHVEDMGDDAGEGNEEKAGIPGEED